MRAPGKEKHTPLRLTHSALMLAYAAWSSATSLELSTCSTLRMLLLRARLWGCSGTPGSLMLGGLGPLMMGEKRKMRYRRAQRVMWQRLTRYATSLVHARACWPVESRCSQILVSRARTLVAYIPKRCSPVRGTARDSLVSLVPPSLGVSVVYRSAKFTDSVYRLRKGNRARRIRP